MTLKQWEQKTELVTNETDVKKKKNKQTPATTVEIFYSVAY